LKKLLLYTGPVKSGKSSRLLSFVQSRKDYGGILSPVFDGKKYLYDIQSGEKRLLEAEAVDTVNEIISAGRYKFKKKVFAWGQSILKKALQENYNYILIDEIGQLELSGSGLSPAADEIIESELKRKINIVVIVRDSLIENFLAHYDLGPDEIEFFNPLPL
jgi:nucleoside-triphosphatase THEP1